MGNSQKPKASFSTILVVIIIITSLFAGGLLGYSIGYLAISGKIDDLENRLSTLQQQIETPSPHRTL